MPNNSTLCIIYTYVRYNQLSWRHNSEIIKSKGWALTGASKRLIYIIFTFNFEHFEL